MMVTEFKSHSIGHLIDGALRQEVGERLEIFTTIIKGGVNDQSLLMRNHQAGSQSAGGVVGSYASHKHGIPTPERLLPEWTWDQTIRILFVATPDVIHQDIKPPLLSFYPSKQALHLLIDCVITTHWNPYTATGSDHLGGFFDAGAR